MKGSKVVVPRLEELKKGVTLQVAQSAWLAERGVHHWTASVGLKSRLIAAQAGSPEVAVCKLAHELAEWITNG